MTGRPLKIAVVGHTNVGKTSLLRTLTRDVTFGEVSDRPGTTRDVSGCAIVIDGRTEVELFDTPGLEDSIGLLESLESAAVPPRSDGFSRVEAFLASPAALGRFSQEAKALRQVMACDGALYVIDARDRVLAKHRDELSILGYCARPVVPVLNFVAGEATRIAEWRDQLARVGMHAVAEFDTVVLEEAGEIRLFEKVRSLLDSRRGLIDALIDRRRRDREYLIDGSARTVADLLIDAASCVMEVPRTSSPPSSREVDRLRASLREREERCVADLLRLHRFRQGDCVASPLPLDNGRWGMDLFSPQALEEYGVRGGGGAAAGAMAGLALDAVFGGLSLGAATAIGAAVGAAVGAGRSPGRAALNRLRGVVEVRADEATIELLALRNVRLTVALLRRGHADPRPLRLDEPVPSSSHSAPRIGAGPSRVPDEIRSMLRRAARRPAWSRLTRGHHAAFISDAARERAIMTLGEAIRPLILRAVQGAPVR